MSKGLSARYYLNKKDILQNKSCEKYRSLSEEEKTKSDSKDENNTKIYLKIESKG